MKSGSSPSESSPSEDTIRGARIVAIANQKGGVGKSTTAVSLGAALAELGHRVLVIDLDPQGNASTGLGIRNEARETTVYDVLSAEAAVEGAIIPTSVEGLFAIPSTIDLAGAEIELVSQFSRELRLRRALEPLREDGFDFVFLDCPPSLGLLTVNALAAAEELIVPIQCEYYALEGLGQLLHNVRLVQQNINPSLRLTGIVMTMFDSRTKLSEQVVEEVRKFFGDRVYDVIIPRTVRLSEAPGFGQPITVYDPRSRAAESYRALAREVAARPPPEAGPMPTFEDMPSMILGPEPAGGLDVEERESAAPPEAEPAPEAEAAPEAGEPAAANRGESSRAPVSATRGSASSDDATPSARKKAESRDGAETPARDESGVPPEGSRDRARRAHPSSRAAAAPPAPARGTTPSRRPTRAAGPRAQAESSIDVASPDPTSPEPTAHGSPNGSTSSGPEQLPPPPSSEPIGAADRPPGRRVVVIDEEAEEAAVRSGQEEEPVRIDRQREMPTEEDRLADIGDTLREEPKRKKRWWQFGKGGEE